MSCFNRRPWHKQRFSSYPAHEFIEPKFRHFPKVQKSQNRGVIVLKLVKDWRRRKVSGWVW